jgi:hypothetical protein
MAPIAQPYSQDTCGIGSHAFATRGCAQSGFGIDRVEMKQSPPNRLHLDPFLSFHPPKSSLSLVDSSPNCRHKLIDASSDGWHSVREPIAITSSSSFHPRRSILVVAITLSLFHRCRCRHRCLSHRCPSCSRRHHRRRCHLCRCCRRCRHPCRWRRCRRCCRRRRHRRHCRFVEGVLVVLLGGQSKEFNQSKPRRYHPWHVDGATALGLAVGWPTALLGRHLVHDVLLSETS